MGLLGEESGCEIIALATESVVSERRREPCSIFYSDVITSLPTFDPPNGLLGKRGGALTRR